MIVDFIKVYNKFSELMIPCGSCGEFDHASKKCGLITYKPIPLKIIHIFQENCYQKRKKVFRNKIKSFKAMRDQFHIESQASKFEKFEKKAIEDYQFKYLALESEMDGSSSDSGSIQIDSVDGGLLLIKKKKKKKTFLGR